MIVKITLLMLVLTTFSFGLAQADTLDKDQPIVEVRIGCFHNGVYFTDVDLFSDCPGFTPFYDESKNEWNHTLTAGRHGATAVPRLDHNIDDPQCRVTKSRY